jgi:hypothetical protein
MREAAGDDRSILDSISGRVEVPVARPAVESDIVHNLAAGGRTVVETYQKAGDPVPESVRSATTRPLTADELEALDQQVRKHIDKVTRAIVPLANSDRTEDLVQVVAGRSTLAESYAALDCLGRGQAFVRLEGSGMRESKAWTFLQYRLGRGDGAPYATVAVDLGRFPDVFAHRQELSNVKRFRNDEICFEWNALEFDVRSRIVDEANKARARLQEIQQSVVAADHRTPEGKAIWDEWARLAALVARMPCGGLGDYLEAIPGRTVFSGRSFASGAIK